MRLLLILGAIFGGVAIWRRKTLKEDASKVSEAAKGGVERIKGGASDAADTSADAAADAADQVAAAADEAANAAAQKLTGNCTDVHAGCFVTSGCTQQSTQHRSAAYTAQRARDQVADLPHVAAADEFATSRTAHSTANGLYDN